MKVADGKVYKIPGRNNKTLTIKVERVLDVWTAPQTGIEYTAVMGTRVRPDQPNVLFGGNCRYYAVHTDEFISI